jgi:hypothetical protein
MKKFIATAAVALIALSGCGADNGPTAARDNTAPKVKVGEEVDLGGRFNKKIRTVVVNVNGADVTCVVYSQGKNRGGGGLDCDWENITGAKR